MRIPAVPKYVLNTAQGLSGVPPGHRFNLYFQIWDKKNWQLDKTAKTDALRECLKLGDAAEPLRALLARQQAHALALPENFRHVVDARSTAPFATGLGLEHPVENGFAFLSPYGLPYLAGSGVKGVLRRAAEELELDEQLPGGATCALFGHEDANEPRRGAVTCWDVFPQPAGDSLAVEIMTPHFNHYLQDGGAPHDAGKPNPIPFLAVPARSEFRFVITCEPSMLPPGFGKWKAASDKIIQHAFDWLGFGAKTAVGYGAIEGLSHAEISAAKAQAESASKRCDWVDQAIDSLRKQTNANAGDTLRGKGLAEAWKQIPDTALKARAKADIMARWQAEGWWNHPPGKASRQAKAIYEEGDTK